MKKPEIGEIWVEVDSRFHREIEILEVSQLHVVSRTIGSNRKNMANIQRFNGRNRRYKFTAKRVAK